MDLLLFCGLLFLVGVKAYDPAHWSNKTVSDDLYRAQLDDLIAMFLNFIDLESISEGRETELTRKLENIKFKPLNLHELSEATEGICGSLRGRLTKLSNVNLQTENYEDLVIKLRDTMAFFTRFDNLPESLEREKYSFDLAVDKENSKGPEYSISDDSKVDETLEYSKGLTELEGLLEAVDTEPSSHDPDNVMEASTSDSLEDRIGSFQEFEETPDVVSIPGVPGQDFPNYEEIPETTFSCEDKEYIPGFYADMDTSCQVFHVCWPHHREIFLCPTGSTFNQEILTCDYWYNSNCDLSPSFYDSNARFLPTITSESDSIFEESDKKSDERYVDTLLLSSSGIKFFPVKFKTYDYPDGKRELDGPRNLFNWKVERALKKKAKSKDEFVDAVLQDKDWVRDFVPVSNEDESSEEPEQTTSEASTTEEIFQYKMGLKSKKHLDSITLSHRSGIEYSTQSTEQNPATTTPSIETSTDSTQTTEQEPDLTTLLLVESTTDSAEISEEESSVSSTPVPNESNIQKLSFLFPKLKGHNSVTGKENIAPAIVYHVLSAAENIINKGVLPLTRQILADSYIKHHKIKY